MKTPLYDEYVKLNIDDSFINLKYVKEYFPAPTKEDYKEGTIHIYFLKKLNDVRIIETSYDGYNSVTGFIYEGVQLTWTISGPKNNVYSDGKIQSQGVIEKNSASISVAEKNMNGIKDKLTNPLQFYKS